MKEPEINTEEEDLITQLKEEESNKPLIEDWKLRSELATFIFPSLTARNELFFGDYDYV